MKFLVLFLIPLLLLIVPKGVDAEGGVWIENNGTCSGSLYSPSDMRHLIKSDDISGIVNSLSGRNSCFNRNDYEISDFFDPPFGGPSVKYCSPGTVVAVKNGKNGYHKDYCCTKAHPYLGNAGDYCCPEELLETNSVGIINCRATLGESGTINQYGLKKHVTAFADEIDSLEEPIQPGTTSYVCPAEGCLVRRAPFMRGTLLNNNFTLATPLNTIQDYECLPMGADLSSYSYEGLPEVHIEAGAVCVAQKAQDPIVATAVAKAPGIMSCTELVGNEQQRCLECLLKNFDAVANNEPQSFVYSSIGCIDTRRDPFITRLFQLGFGMLSGIAVVRIMFAAVKMQSDDPAKHQEGRDMITSAVAALVVLAAAIPILQYIGINLLSLFDS